MNIHEEIVKELAQCGTLTAKVEKSQMCMCKEEWIQYYADRMLGLWQVWQTRLGIARSYVEKLKLDLAELYEEPLKRMFIEATY